MRLVARALNEPLDPTLYPFSPSEDHYAASAQQVNDPLRSQVVPLLSHYQTLIGNTDSAAQASLAQLREGALCIVTGQQVGFMGGPLMTLAKALSCVWLAREKGAVPIFWVPTEDHDVEEVSWTHIMREGNLQRFGSPQPHRRFVEDLPWTEQVEAEVARFCQELHLEKWKEVVRAERYAEAMIRLLVELFRGSGLLFLEPAPFRHLAQEFVEREVRDAAHLRAHIRREGPIRVHEERTGLFYKNDQGFRVPLMQGEGFPVADPHRYSMGVAARCVWQSYLLPVAAYVAGPTELRYWGQLKEYFAAHGVVMPWVVRRMGLTLIPPREARILEQVGSAPWEPLSEGLTGFERHLLEGLLQPKKRPQERVLNSLAHGARFLPALLQEGKWNSNTHLYATISEATES